MNIPQESEIRDSRRQPRKWPHVRTLQLGGMAAIPIAIGVIWVVVGFKATSTLWKARADADRLDPGWRFADIVKQQAIIPDRLNSAIQVRLVLTKMAGPFPPVAKTVQQSGNQNRVYQDDIQTRLEMVPVEERLDIGLTSELRRVLRPFSVAILEARKLADTGRGRTDPAYAKLLWSTPLGYVVKSRDVTRLLQADTKLLIQDGQFDAAIDGCRAMLGVARSIGDDPFMISQLVRMAFEGSTVSTAERVLNQGQVSDAVLAKFQSDLLVEAEQPLGLWGQRGERGMTDDVLDHLATGQATYRQVQGVGGNIPTTASEILTTTSSAFVRYNQGLVMSRMNEATEIAKKPLVEQTDLWNAWDSRATPSDSAIARLASSLSRETITPISAFHTAYIRSRAEMFAMVILIAAERHRMAHGTFADRIEDIDPRFLSRKFLDPFSPTGAPLQYKSDGEGGVIVYSVSHDRKDNGGEKLGIKKWMNNGNDLGFRLRAVSKRGQPAQRDTLPTDVFQEIREENAKDPFHD